MRYTGLLKLIILSLLFISNYANSQCLIPTSEGDTAWPVIQRMKTDNPFSGDFPLSGIDETKYISKAAIAGNTMYLGGMFSYIGPNTGYGALMDQNGTVLSAKKWRVNGPVLASVPDGIGGYYIAGQFTEVGNDTHYHLAHIDGQGMPNSWSPDLNGEVRAMILRNDTLIVGGSFTSVNGAARNSIAFFSTNTGSLLPLAPNAVTPGTIVNCMKLIDDQLYVGSQYNSLGGIDRSFFYIDTKAGFVHIMPALYQMEEIKTIDASDDKQRIYIGGAAGSTTNSNGFCLDRNTGNLVFRIDIGLTTPPGYPSMDSRASIYNLKVLGNQVYAGGIFNFGIINGNNFSQKGLVVFDATNGQIQPVLNDCDRFVSSIHANNGQVYIGGEFYRLGGQNCINFAIFDPVSKNITNSNIKISDQVKTMSFAGNDIFIGGYFSSIGGENRSGFAAFDMTTGALKPWAPAVIISQLNDIKAKGDTLFMAGSFYKAGTGESLGGLLAVNAQTGQYYTVPNIYPQAYELLIDNDFLYVVGGHGTYGNDQAVKITLSGLSEVGTWKPNPGFYVKSIQKNGNLIYVSGDNYASNPTVGRGYVAEIDDNLGQVKRVFSLSDNAVRNDFAWMNKSLLVGDKLFLVGVFSKILGADRGNFAAINVKDGSLLNSNLNFNDGWIGPRDLKFHRGNLYIGGSFLRVNNSIQKFVAVSDTSFLVPFPDHLKLNSYYPSSDIIAVADEETKDQPITERVNCILFNNDKMILSGGFRNVEGNEFKGIASLNLTAGPATLPLPFSIVGPDSLNSFSQNNSYAVNPADNGYRYGWTYTGDGITINNNGSSSVTLNVGALANSGVLKVVAVNECGSGDTVYHPIGIRTMEPTLNASNLLIVRKTDSTATIKFSIGNGERRIVVLKKMDPITNMPTDGSEYSANNRWGQGADLGDQTYVVFKGAGDSVNLKGLSPFTIYQAAVFEFNGSGNASNYLTSNFPSAKFITFATQPSVQASNITFSNKTTNSITVNVTPGNGEKRLVLIQKSNAITAKPQDSTSYPASTIFGYGFSFGNQAFVISNTSTPVNVTGLEAFTLYHVTVFEYNGTDSAIKYLATNNPDAWFYTYPTEPTVQASNISVSVSGSTASITATPGNGAGRLVVLRQDLPITDVPVDRTKYNFSTQFGLGSSIGQNSYVMRLFTPTTVSNLRSGRTYYVKLFEFNGADSLSDYLIDNAPGISFTTPVTEPTLQATNITVINISDTAATINYTGGSGDRHLTVVRKDNPVVDAPVDGTSYTANALFGSGSDIGHNSYVVGDQSNPVSLRNLQPGAIYYIKVFDFNGSGTSTDYLLTNAPEANFVTPNCSGATSLTLCTPVTTSIPTGNGFWNFSGFYPDNSCGQLTWGKEAIYRFTPQKSGVYYLDVTSADGKMVDYLYKAGGACTPYGWTGIDRKNAPGKSAIGFLQAGVDYYIVLDAETNQGATQTFRICSANLQAPTTFNTCIGSGGIANAIPANSSKTEYVIDGSGNLIASLDFSNVPNSVGSVAVSYYVNNSGIRHNGSGQEYLDRNYTISTQYAPSAPVKVRLYFLNTELNTLINDPHDGVGDVSNIGQLGVNKTTQTCVSSNLMTANGIVLAQTGNGSLGTDVSFIEVNTPGFSTFYIDAAPSAALPLNIISFNGIHSSNINMLKWTTSNEQGITGFEVEKSIDGMIYRKIGWITSKNLNGAVSTQFQYEFGDSYNIDQNTYYRLKIVEFNGSTKYSSVILLKNSDNILGTVSIFPNPVHDVVHLNIETAASETSSVVIIDLLGKEVMKRDISLNKGVNSIDIRVNNISNGLYLIRLMLKDSNASQSVRFLKK